MKIAYLVFAYRNPRLLKRSIEALSSEDCDFFIHIDRRVDLGRFSEIRGPRIRFLENRIPVHWAEFSGVRAILLLIRQALTAPRQYDYLILLSGSEYPLRSREYIQEFLQDHHGQEFLNLVKMPNQAMGKPLSRIDTLRFPSIKPVRRFVAKVLAKMGAATRDHRKYLGGLEPYSGNTWWALTSHACQHIETFVNNHPEVVRFFENTFAPEEMFVHTILGNSGLRSRIRRSLVYEDWPGCGAHPAMLTAKHIDFLNAQQRVYMDDGYGSGEVLFARKFSDETIDLTERLDRRSRSSQSWPVQAP